MNAGTSRFRFDPDSFDSAHPFMDAVLSFAPVAYERCVVWFGEPDDAHRPIRFYANSIIRAGYNPIDREYMMLLPRDSKHWEEICENLSYLMFLRFADRKRGLHRLLWVKHLLAELTAVQLLREQGFDWYTAQRRDEAASVPQALNVAALRRARRNYLKLFRPGGGYPEGFGAGIVLLAERIEQMMDWSIVRQLVGCARWNDWYALLPAETRAEAVAVLE